MNTRLAIIFLSLGFAPCLTAQKTVRPAPSGTIIDLVEEFQSTRSGSPNEVTVVLPPPDETPFAAEAPASGEDAPDPVPADDSKDEAPAGDEAEKPQAAAAEETPVVDSPKEPEPGLSVRVERLQTGAAEIDPAKVKLLAPFPAKLLARAPEGWRVESSGNAPPVTREVELAPGKRITLNVRPHLLVAEADGSNVFLVEEPGFDAALGYRQKATVAAILSTSIRQLEDDSIQLGAAIDKLQQLLVSLPQPPDVPDPEPEAEPKPKRKR